MRSPPAPRWHHRQLGRPYRGVNLLGCLGHQLDYGHPSSAYLTFQQAKSLGGWVRHGERGVLLLYREVPVPVKDQADDVDDGRRMFLAKGFTVFIVEQTGGLDDFRKRLEGAQARGFQPLDECERIVRSTGAVIRETGTQATYSPALDLITMPPRRCFRRAEDFYATLWHECVHWTGAKHRLNRDLGGAFGSSLYAQEELVAELGACFLSGRVGIEHVSRSASYVASWLAALHDDRRFIFAAAKLASSAAAYVIGQPDSRDQIDA